MVAKVWPQVQERDDPIVSSDKKQSVNRSGTSPRYLPPPVKFHPHKILQSSQGALRDQIFKHRSLCRDFILKSQSWWCRSHRQIV